jgi:hypothetical protein
MRYLKRLFFWWLEWFLATKFWKSIVRMTPRLYGYPKFPLEQYFTLRDIVRKDPAAIYCFVGVDNSSVSTLIQRRILNFYWAHSGFVYLDEDNELSIHHLRWYGLLRWKLLKYLRECDEFALIRLPLTEDEKEIANARIAKIAKSKLIYKLRDNIHLEDQHTDKDFWLKTDHFTLYCSEYQYVVCKGLMNSVWDSGKVRFAPDDIYRGGEVVWEFRGKK